ncbi:MAG: MBL fold metallo-hydrolase [Labilithrix sp.]|nr:MBL fold metallo-hydrolase [Labilithrix sp.]MCW5816364.1 MBL fold metallo-hydrolase [Labilithrix sp.]
MKYLHLRNATALVTLGRHRFLVDPMLSDAGAMMGFKLFGGGYRRNPLVALPPIATRALREATAAIVTHAHPDHLDGPGLALLRERTLPTWTSAHDAPSLRRKGVHAHDVAALEDVQVEAIRSRHGRGFMGWAMGVVHGFFLAHPGEPTLYLVGDSVLTDAVLEAIERLRPDVVVAPAGAANMGLGGDILFSVDELVTLARATPGTLILNHLEALDHCPTRRADLTARMRSEGLSERVLVPSDGEELVLAPAR